MKKAAIVFATLAGILVLFIWLFWFQAAMLFRNQQLSDNNPAVKQVPKSLDVTTASSAPGLKLSYAGYGFEVPWSDMDNEPRVLHNGAALNFKSGIGLLFLTSPPNELVSSLCVNADKTTPGAARQVYGDDAVKSDYDLQRAMLESTPDKVNLFSSRRDVIRNSTLLLLKSLTLPKEAESGMFNISNGRFRGFQIGTPGRQVRKIVVNLYSDDGSVEMFLAQKEGNLLISQAEVNRVIQTLRRTGPPVPPVKMPKPCL